MSIVFPFKGSYYFNLIEILGKIKFSILYSLLTLLSSLYSQSMIYKLEDDFGCHVMVESTVQYSAWYSTWYSPLGLLSYQWAPTIPRCFVAWSGSIPFCANRPTIFQNSNPALKNYGLMLNFKKSFTESQIYLYSGTIRPRPIKTKLCFLCWY